MLGTMEDRGQKRWRVERDAHGIPHLWGEDVLTLAHAQGHVTALDRGWQIEHQRWRMEGRTAEHVGPAGLEWDIFARQVGLEPTVRRCYEALDHETQAWLQAYVAGVDEALAEGLSRAPELTALGLTSESRPPRPWAPWTPLGIFWAIHLLFGTFPSKLWGGHVVDTVGAELLPLINAEGLDGREAVDQSGSNAWVIGGGRTATGAPLLAGDPHRTIELPGGYQQVGLACPEFDVVGFTFPGVPGVAHFAHAGSVAWGITNAMADYQDLATESLRVSPGGMPGGMPVGGAGRVGSAPSGSLALEARGVDGWEPVASTSETILVRGADPVVVPVVVTARGPVVTGLAEAIAAAVTAADGSPADGSPAAGSLANGTTADRAPANRDAADDSPADGDAARGPHPPAYSLRTPSQVEGDLGFASLLPLLRARTVDDVERALSAWVEPVNSALVADISGRMRHVVIGRVPDRDVLNTAGPVPAWDPRHRWIGRRENAARDIDDVMVSANDRASGGGLGVDYATPFRALRIRELIGERRGLTVEDCAAIHVDTLNGQAVLMRALVVATAEDALSVSARSVRRVLLTWDQHSDRDSSGAATFAAWRTALVRWFTAQPQLGPLHEASGHSPLFASWLDVEAQVGAGWHALATGGHRIGLDVSSGVVAALETVAAQASPTRLWGESHRLAPLHPLAAMTGPDGARLVGVPTVDPDPVAGDKGCVLAAASAPGVTDLAYGGPVARYVWDLSDRAASGWVVPFGASGLPDDPHFVDQTGDWLEGRLVPVAGSPTIRC